MILYVSVLRSLSYDLNNRQKHILKEFIESVDSTPRLKEFYNSEVKYIQTKLIEEIAKTKDEAIKIKLQEVSKLIVELDKRCKVNSSHLVDLLQYHNLLEELTVTHG